MSNENKTALTAEEINLKAYEVCADASEMYGYKIGYLEGRKDTSLQLEQAKKEIEELKCKNNNQANTIRAFHKVYNEFFEGEDIACSENLKLQLKALRSQLEEVTKEMDGLRVWNKAIVSVMNEHYKGLTIDEVLKLTPTKE